MFALDGPAIDGRPLAAHAFLRRLSALPFVDALWLFGSRARGTARPRADIDLAVACPRAGPAQWARIREIIEEADTLLEIDCVRLDALAADDPLRTEIERNGRIVFRREPS